MFENDDLPLTDASELREVTVTQDEIYNRRKQAFWQNICSTATSRATGQGLHTAEFQLVENAFGPVEVTQKLINETKTKFEELGYNVSIQEVPESEKINKFTLLTIDWSPSVETIN